MAQYLYSFDVCVMWSHPISSPYHTPRERSKGCTSIQISSWQVPMHPSAKIALSGLVVIAQSLDVVLVIV